MADGATRKVKKKSSSGSKTVDKETADKKKQLEASIRIQVAAEEKAHRIVEELVLENSISEKYLLEIGNYITQIHYSDIVEERAIAKVCGYPLCSNPLTQVPKQKYKISVKTNRVFDITERKNYCSNFCYKASKYLESQIPSSSVWTRIGESPKQFTLLKATDSSFKPSPGEMLVGSEKLESLDLRNENVPDKENESIVGGNETSRSNKYSPENQMRNSTPDYKESDDNNKVHSTKETKDNEVEVTSKLNKLTISPSCNSTKDNNTRKVEHKVKDDTGLSNKLSFSSDKEKDKEISFDKNEKQLTEKDVLTKQESTRSAKEIFLNTIKDILLQWFTNSTHRYLSMVTWDSDTLGDDGDAKKITENNTIEEEGFPCVVPPIDSKSQLTTRRQIVLQKLTQVLPEILLTTSYNKSELITHFTGLVRTFSLDSRNTMFKPLQWKVLGTVLVHLLEKHRGLKGGGFPSNNREIMLVHLGLTLEDMTDIIDSISMNIPDTTSCEVDKEQHLSMYSRMEDLD